MRDNAEQIRALIEGWAGAVHEGRIDTVVADHAEDLVMVHSAGRGDGDHGYPRATAAYACGAVVVELGGGECVLSVPPGEAREESASGQHGSWRICGTRPGRVTRRRVRKQPLTCKNAGREPTSRSTSMLRTMFKSES